MEAVNPFFEQHVLNSPYDEPSRQWELDSSGQPIQRALPPSSTRRIDRNDTSVEETKCQDVQGSLGPFQDDKGNCCSDLGGHQHLPGAGRTVMVVYE